MVNTARKPSSIQTLDDRKGQKRGRGQPTKYKHEFVQMIYDFVDENRDHYLKLKTSEANGTVKHILQVDLPTIFSFAKKIKVSVTTIDEWQLLYPDFLKAITYLKNEQKQRLINGGLSGQYNNRFTMFLCSVNHGMHETIKTENENKDVSGFVFEKAEPIAEKKDDIRERFE